MGNPRIRGLVYFVGFLAFAGIFCGLMPFIVLPNNGLAAALPVIEVPGEVVVAEFLPGFNLTNTIIGTVITDIIVLMIVAILWRRSDGWTKEIPGRAQGAFEAFIEAFYDFCYNIGGNRLRSAPLLWPLVATIFLFLLTANYMKLLPGVETVGTMHCAYAGQSGYYAIDGWTDGSYRLWADEPLNAGTTQTAETEALCNRYFKEDAYEPFALESVEEINTSAAAYQTILAALPDEFLDEAGEPLEGDELHDAEDEAYETALEEYTTGAEADPAVVEIVEDSDFKTASSYVEFAPARIEQVEAFDAAEFDIESAETEIATLTGAIAEEVEETEAEIEEAAEAVEDAVEINEDTVVDVEAVEEDIDAEVTILEDEITTLEEARDLARARVLYPGAVLPLTEEQIENDVKPFIFHITPFVRGPATDLSLTFALAIFAIIGVQIYGVLALGPAYFEKFINLSAIGNAGKRPLGIIDFVVGLIEIISEIGKIVSLAFRLFGNLFAGGVALMAVTFLLSWFVPGIILGLELIIGAVQALVFAVLTLVFSVQAMEAHHGDHDDHHDDAEHEAAH
jgi:F0F1-type ATP synthase membrane subunit a